MAAVVVPDIGSLCPTQLHWMCLAGRLDLLLAAAGQYDFPRDLEMTNCRGHTPFLLAVQSGNVDLAVHLLETGSSVHHLDSFGNNALHLVAAARPRRTSPRRQRRNRSSEEGDVIDDWLRMADILVSNGVDIRHRNRLGLTPVRLASLVGNDELGRRMLKRAFVQSVARRPTNERFCLDANYRRSRAPSDFGEPVEITKNCLGSTEQQTTTPFVARRQLARMIQRHIISRAAITSKTPDCVDSLQFHAVDAATDAENRSSCDRRQAFQGRRGWSLVDIPCSLGFTPLYGACMDGDFEYARILLDVYQADPDAPSLTSSLGHFWRNVHNTSCLSLPLGAAILRNDLPLVHLLLDRGASACRCLECLADVDAVDCSLERRSESTTTQESEKDAGNFLDDSIDTLELSLLTDWPVCRVLVAAGACFTQDAANCVITLMNCGDLASTTVALDALTAVYEANGNREAVLRVLKAATTSSQLEIAGDVISEKIDVLSAAVRQCDSLLQLCRLKIRESLRPRMYSTVRQLPLPNRLQSYVLME